MNHQLIFLIRVSYKVINYNIVSKIIKNKIQLVEKKTRDQEHIKLKLVEKNFPLLNINNKIPIKDLLYKEKTISDSIIYLRKLSESLNITNLDNINYGIGLVVKCIDKMNYLYDRSLNIKNVHKNNKKNKKIDSIHSIINLSYLNSHFISKSQYYEICKVSSLMINFEYISKIDEFIHNLNIIPFNVANSINDKEKFIFMNSLTAHSCLMDYDYETLETIGDSILKFMVSYSLYISNNNGNEGKLVKERTKIICNDNLLKIGNNFNIQRFIYGVNFSNIKSTWVFPLQYNSLNTYHEVYNDKYVVDIIESTIAAVFNISAVYAFKLIAKYKMVDFLDNNQIKHITESMTCVKNQLNSNETNFKLVEDKLELNIEFTYLAQIFIKREFQRPTLFINNFKNVAEVQAMIKYVYKDTNNLKTAFTPRSTNKQNNLERLEFLGDAVIECYLMSNFMNLMYLDTSQYDSIGIIGKNKKLNQQLLTNCKSYLASNQFMALIMHQYNLINYIDLKDKTVELSISNFLKNVNLEFNINSYHESKYSAPKVISDVFEAFIGSIFIDSLSLSCVFEILNLFYLPFICYSTKYLECLKFSSVSELTTLLSEKKITPMFFYKNNEESLIEVQLILKPNEELNSSISYEFSKEKGIKFNTVVLKSVSKNKERAKELLCIEAIKLYFI